MTQPTIYQRKKGQWGPFTPDLIILAAMREICQMILSGQLSTEQAEEFLFNPRTYESMTDLGCSVEVLGMFENFMMVNDWMRMSGKEETFNYIRSDMEKIQEILYQTSITEE